MTKPGSGGASGLKAELRRRLRADRIAGMESDASSGAAIAAVGSTLPELTDATVIAAYVPRAGEPDIWPLVVAAADRGARVLLPVLLPDRDLDWAALDASAGLGYSGVVGRAHLREPTGTRLGRAAINDASVVFVPALAVDPAGNRLGQGGGSYDRALARTTPAALTVAIVFEREVLPAIPVDDHDQPVAAAITPVRLLRFR